MAWTGVKRQRAAALKGVRRKEDNLLGMSRHAVARSVGDV